MRAAVGNDIELFHRSHGFIGCQLANVIRDVDVFGKAFDYVVNFRKCGTAFEYQMRSEIRGEEDIVCFHNPDVLLQ